MGIEVEFNPDLALRSIEQYRNGTRSLEECIPDPLKVGSAYDFLKQGQRNYWLLGEIPLVQTEGQGNLSRPLASIVIIEATHFLKEEKPYTRGTYQVIAVFDPSDSTVHFEAMERRY